MKKALLGLLVALLMVPGTSFAQVSDPIERARITALIEVLLNRIEELKAEMAAKDKEAKRQARTEKAEQKKREEDTTRLKEITEELVVLETKLSINQNLRCEYTRRTVKERPVTYEYTYISYSKKQFTEQSGTVYPYPGMYLPADTRCATENLDYFTNLKLEKLRLEESLGV